MHATFPLLTADHRNSSHVDSNAGDMHHSSHPDQHSKESGISQD